MINKWLKIAYNNDAKRYLMNSTELRMKIAMYENYRT